MKAIKEIYPLLNQPKNIVVTMHQKPDADAMGSALGLYHFLVALGHRVQVVSPTNWADWLKWMRGAESVLDYELNPAKVDSILTEADWIFCLDFNALFRVKNMEKSVRSFPGKKILIDHHQHPDKESFDFGISDESKSSTAEMIFDFIIESDHKEELNVAIAECLYAGVMADTGSFRFTSATGKVHRMVADLMDTGFDHTKIYEGLFDNFLENRLRFIGHVLQHRMEIYYEFNTALIAVPWKDLVRYQIKTGDTEGLVNFPLSIQGIKLAALIIDRDEEIKCSFRSKGNFDVNEFARTYFNGGGHFNASGGRSSDTLDQTVHQFIQAMKENASQLQ